MLAPRLRQLLSKFSAEHLLRHRDIIQPTWAMINFCSNDYLNLSTHPKVIKAFRQGAQQYGLGSGASPSVSGYTFAHHQLEEKLAEFLQRDKAILFNSGYHANLGVITTFANRNSTIIADKLCHASLIDGIVLSRARCKRYRHNDYSHAEKIFQLSRQRRDELLFITESVFSMQGDITNVKKLVSIANNEAMLLVDDAHGIGVLGKKGGGICDYYQLSQSDVPCLVTPFGKALGSFGAIVSGSSDIIDALIQCARTYRYSTALPPAVCSATLASLTVLMEESWRRSKLQALITFFIKEAKLRNLPCTSFDETPIKSIITGCNKLTLKIQHKLAHRGFLVSCIRPPTVPINQSCIRISLNCMHTEEQIICLLNLLHDYFEYENQSTH
jgi:8-amino-7-oxononanoate synthase